MGAQRRYVARTRIVRYISLCCRHAAAPGRLPEWPKGAVCKPVGSAYVGSNPTPATTCENGPLAANSRAGGRFFSVPVCVTLERWRPLRGGVHGRIADGTRGQGAVWVAA